MLELTKTTSHDTSSQTQKNRKINFINRYQLILTRIISFGLLVFVNGFFCFPEISWVKTSFYLLVLLPGIALLPLQLKNFPLKSRHLVLFMLLPLYLCLSHFWADAENITRDFFFFAKQVIFIFMLIFCFWVASKENKKFIVILLLSLVVTGSFFSFLSIVQYLYQYQGHLAAPLMGFSLTDSNKMAALHTVHLSLCIYFLKFNAYPYKSTRKAWPLLVAIALDLALITLTQAKAIWFIIPVVTIALLTLRTTIYRKISIFSCITIISIAYILKFDAIATLQNLHSYIIRVELIKHAAGQIRDNYLFGLGLTYKLPIPLPSGTYSHPHNMIVDCLRFGGALGIILLLAQTFSVIQLSFLNRKNYLSIVLVLWYISGFTLLCLYGQQPLTRPGYIWFLLWIPSSILLSNHLIRESSIKVKRQS